MRKSAQLLKFDLARTVNNDPDMTNRLDLIVMRQRKSRVRDGLFALAVGIAALVGVSTVGSAVHGASAPIAQAR